MAGERQIEAGKAFLKFDIRSKSLLAGIGKIEGRLRRSASSINSMGQRIASAGQSLQGLGKGIAGIAVAAGAPLALSTARFASFDDAIRAAGARMGATKKQVEALSIASRRLGRQTSFTASSMAELAGVLGQAGFNPSQVIQMQNAVQQLARATGVELADSAGIVAATLRQFNLQASDATRVADVLTSAVNGSFLSLESLGDSLSYVGSVSAASGTSLEETVALVGQLGNVAIQGSSSGTSLRRLITEIQANGAKIKRIFNVDPTGLKITDALDQIGASIANLSREQQAAKLNEAFGLLGITSATVLSQSANQVRTLENRFLNAKGTAAKTAKEIDAGVGGSFRRLTSAIEGTALAIGEAISVPAVAYFEKLSASINAVTDQLERNPAAVRQLAKGILLAGASGAGLAAAGTALVGIGFGVVALSSAVSLAATTLGVATTAAGALVGAVGVIPLAAAAGVSAATGIFAGLGSTFRNLALSAMSAGRSIASSMTSAAQRIKSVYGQGGLVATFQQITKEIKYLFRLLGEQIKLPMLQASYVIASAFSAMVRNIAASVQSLANLIAQLDPSGVAASVAQSAGAIASSVGAIPGGIQKSINNAQRQIARLLANPPAAVVPIQQTNWFSNLRSAATNLANTILGAFTAGSQQAGAVISNAGATASAAGRRGSIGSTDDLFAMNSANFGLPNSAADQQLDTQQAMLAQLQNINANTQQNAGVNAPASVASIGSAISNSLSQAGQAITNHTSQVVAGIKQGFSLIGRGITLPSKQPTGKPFPPPPFKGSLGSRFYYDPSKANLGDIEPPSARGNYLQNRSSGVQSLIDSQTSGNRYTDEVFRNRYGELVRTGFSDMLSAIQSAFKNSHIGFRASGGPVKRGGSYVVGEEGPELFVPSKPGHILSNDASKKVDGALANGTIDKNKLIFGNFTKSPIERPNPALSLPNSGGIFDKPKPSFKLGTVGRLERQLQAKRVFEKERSDRIAAAQAAIAKRKAEQQARADEFARKKAAQLAKGQEIKDLRAKIRGPKKDMSFEARRQRNLERRGLAPPRQPQPVFRPQQRAAAVAAMPSPMQAPPRFVPGGFQPGAFQQPAPQPVVPALGGPNIAAAGAQASASMMHVVVAKNDPELIKENQKQTSILERIANNTAAGMQ